jgi:hypothetical protein
MTQFHSMDGLLNSLLSDQVLGKDLSADDKATVRAMVGELMGELDGQLPYDPMADQEIHDETDSIASSNTALTEFNTLLSELGVDSNDISADVAMNDLLHEQSDINLVEILGHHVDAASDVVEVLSTRPNREQMLDELRRVELQLTALSFGVADLRHTLEYPTQHPAQHPWKQSLKALLLREFNIVNVWVRGL